MEIFWLAHEFASQSQMQVDKHADHDVISPSSLFSPLEATLSYRKTRLTLHAASFDIPLQWYSLRIVRSIYRHSPHNQIQVWIRRVAPGPTLLRADQT